MNEYRNNQQLRAVSRLLWHVDIGKTAENVQWRKLASNLEWELHAIISVIWAADLLGNECNDLTIDKRETENRVLHLVALAKDMATDLEEIFSNVRLEIEKAADSLDRKDRRGNREGGVK